MPTEKQLLDDLLKRQQIDSAKVSGIRHLRSKDNRILGMVVEGDFILPASERITHEGYRNSRLIVTNSPETMVVEDEKIYFIDKNGKSISNTITITPVDTNYVLARLSDKGGEIKLGALEGTQRSGNQFFMFPIEGATLDLMEGVPDNRGIARVVIRDKATLRLPEPDGKKVNDEKWLYVQRYGDLLPSYIEVKLKTDSSKVTIECPGKKAVNCTGRFDPTALGVEASRKEPTGEQPETKQVPGAQHSRGVRHANLADKLQAIQNQMDELLAKGKCLDSSACQACRLAHAELVLGNYVDAANQVEETLKAFDKEQTGQNNDQAKKIMLGLAGVIGVLRNQLKTPVENLAQPSGKPIATPGKSGPGHRH